MDRICAAAVAVALLICILLMNGAALGIPAKANTMGYEDRLFDTSRVHTVDIVIDDWDTFLQTAQSEEYSLCNVVIDGEAFRNIGIRAKGNTSLSNVASMDSDRYSFKLEFDQYDSTQSYHGLDKLSLNNLIQDNTMMKDYLTYQMMRQFGVAAPLCSYVYITVNGEDWGLYLAVEAVEDSFLLRNYGSDCGELYKPDSMEMGGGRGNGKDFDFEDFMDSSDGEASSDPVTSTVPDAGVPGGQGGFGQQGGMLPGGMGTDGTGGRGGMSMGSEETMLQYIDDDPDSYSTIFSSAKTDVTDADRARLIAALKELSEGSESAVDTEAVLRYFVVHNYVVNGDSYTGSMVHNYYLYEENGQLSMIPWDYNLAFGTFQGSSADEAVNDDIDAPLSVTGSDRPMIDWIFRSEEYTALYHQYFREFLDTVDTAAILSQAEALIAPYVGKDPTKFCTYEEFETAVDTLTAFCRLRSQSVALQLSGQDGTVDASSITLSDMGTMSNGIGGGEMPGIAGSGESQIPTMPGDASGNGGGEIPQLPQGQDGMQQPGQGEMQEIPGQSGSTEPSSGADTEQRFPGFGAQGGMTLPEGMQMPVGTENTLPAHSGGAQQGFPDSGQADPSAQSSSPWLLPALTLLILAAGLLFAFKFKR